MMMAVSQVRKIIGCEWIWGALMTEWFGVGVEDAHPNDISEVD